MTVEGATHTGRPSEDRRRGHPSWFGGVDGVGGEFDDLGAGEDLVAELLDGVDDVTGGSADDVGGDGLGEMCVGPVRPLVGEVADDLVDVDDPQRLRSFV